MNHKIRSIALLAMMGCGLGAHLQAQAASYFVDPDLGNDGGPGTSSQPWRTLAHVNDAAPLVKGDVVHLRAGKVWVGTLRARPGVRYTSEPQGDAAKPLIRGSVSVPAARWLGPDANGVWVADVTQLVPEDKDAYGNTLPVGVSHLFMNGERMIRARYPNLGGGTFPQGARRYVPSGENTIHLPVLDAGGQPVYTSRGEPVMKSEHLLDVGNTVWVKDGGATVSKTVAALLSGEGRALDGADVFVKNNDWYMTRYKVVGEINAESQLRIKAEDKDNNSYEQDRKAPRALEWPGVTNYPIKREYGYWLEGKRWMLDADREWVYEDEGGTKKLYVKLPAGVTPASVDLRAAAYAHGITAVGQVNGAGANPEFSVHIDNIAVAETRSDGVRIDALDSSTTGLRLDGLHVRHAGRKGIAVLYARPNATALDRVIVNSVVENPINEGIDLTADRRWLSAITWRIDVRNNIVRNAGGGYYGRGAILMGHRGDAVGNQVENASYIGIHGSKLNEITHNKLTAMCLGFDDCGAIYTQGNLYGLTAMEPSVGGQPNDVGGRIAYNHVLGTLVNEDRLDGSGGSNGYNDGVRATTAGGIYLDDYASGVEVSDNYVEGGDAGIILHQGRNNQVRRNTLVGNRIAVWLQENLDPTPLMSGNVIESNVLASASSEPLVFAQSRHQDTALLATFRNNRYAGHRSVSFAQEEDLRLPAKPRFKTFIQWQQGGRDSGSTLHATGFGIQKAEGATAMVTQGVFTGASNNDWQTYNGVLVPPAAGIPHLIVQPAAQADETPPLGSIVDGRRRFSLWPDQKMVIQKGAKYWLTFDVQADTPTELVIRFQRAWSPNMPSDDLSIPINVQAGSQWQSVSRLITAGETMHRSGLALNANALLTFEAFQAPAAAVAMTAKVRLANVQLFQARVVTGHAQPQGIHNDTGAPVTVNCPSGVPTTMCGRFANAADGRAVRFPLTLPAWSGMALITTHPQWLDRDRDGIPGDPAWFRAGYLDVCAGSADGVSVKENGCKL